MSLEEDLDKALEREDEVTRILVAELVATEWWERLREDLLGYAQELGKEVVVKAAPILFQLVLSEIRRGDD